MLLISSFAGVYCPHHDHYVYPSLSRNHGYAVTVFGGFAASTARHGKVFPLCMIAASFAVFHSSGTVPK
jgi:hypothetical protein